MISAAASGAEALVKFFLNKSVNVYIWNQYEQIALDIASQRDHENVVRLLLNYLIDINKNARSRALERAVNHGHIDVVQLLLQHSASIHAEDYDSWDNVLEFAVSYICSNHLITIRLLLEHIEIADIKKGHYDRALLLTRENDGLFSASVQLLEGARIESSDVEFLEEENEELSSSDYEIDKEEIRNYDNEMTS